MTGDDRKNIVLLSNTYLMPRQTDIITISLPRVITRELEEVSRQEARSRSEILRDAFRFFLESRKLDRFQRVGEEIAFKLGIERDDDVEKFLKR